MLAAMPRHPVYGANNALLVAECDQRIDTKRLRRALERFLDACPLPAARLKRPFPWGALHWHAGPRESLAPPAVIERVASYASLPELIEGELNTPVDPMEDAPIRFLVVDHGAAAARTRASLLMTWFHPLMDPRGAQNLLLHLAHLDARDAPPWGETPPAFTAPPDPRPFLERARVASKCYELMQRIVPAPPFSPGTGLATPGPVRFVRDALTESDELSDAVRAKRDMWWRLALVGSVLAEIGRERGWPDRPLLVPISIDLRRKGDPEPTFGNQLGIHFARFMPADTANIETLAKRLREQIAQAVRDGAIDTVTVGMEFLKYRRPAKVMQYGMPWAAAGSMFSFACADIGEFPAALTTAFGARILDAYHAATVPPQPGLGVFFNRVGRTVNLMICWTEGALEERHVARLREVLRNAVAKAAPEYTTM
jgi:hypothetical protein